MKDDQANDIVEAVLTKMSNVPAVGDLLEAMSVEDYDQLEDDLWVLVREKLD